MKSPTAEELKAVIINMVNNWDTGPEPTSADEIADQIIALCQSYHHSKLAEAMPKRVKDDERPGKLDGLTVGEIWNACIDAMEANLKEKS